MGPSWAPVRPNWGPFGNAAWAAKAYGRMVVGIAVTEKAGRAKPKPKPPKQHTGQRPEDVENGQVIVSKLVLRASPRC